MLKIKKEAEIKEIKNLNENKMPDSDFYKIISRVNQIIQDAGEINAFSFNNIDTIRIQIIKIENALTVIEHNVEKAKKNAMLQN